MIETTDSDSQANKQTSFLNAAIGSRVLPFRVQMLKLWVQERYAPRHHMHYATHREFSEAGPLCAKQIASSYRCLWYAVCNVPYIEIGKRHA